MQDARDRQHAPAAGGQASTGAAAASWTLGWGQLLRTARQVAGLSLTELSARTGLSKGYLSKLESGAEGAANPSRATLAALARALPSFRPVALTLEPGLGAQELEYTGIVSVEAVYPGAGQAAQTVEDVNAAPVQLGWRELETLAALVALDAAALPQPVTTPILARAVGRDVASVVDVLEGLITAGVVKTLPPTRPGGPPSYACSERAAARIGVTRVGDLLVLAGALLAGGPPSTSARVSGVTERDPSARKRP